MAYWTGFTYPYGSNTIITNDLDRDVIDNRSNGNRVYVIPFKTNQTSLLEIGYAIPDQMETASVSYDGCDLVAFITNIAPSNLNIVIGKETNSTNVVLKQKVSIERFLSFSFQATGGTLYYLCLSIADGTRQKAFSSTNTSYFTIDLTNFINNFTITYNSNGGTAVSAPSEYNDSILPLTLPTPTKTGYTFNGWYTTSNTTPIKILPSGSTGNKAFIANWTPTNYSITYNLNNGTQASGAITTYTIETSTFNLPIPTRTNYAFVGWYDNSSFTGNRITQIAKGSYENKTYYAKWALIQTFYWTNTNSTSNGLSYYLHNLVESNGVPINLYASANQFKNFLVKINTYCGVNLTFNEKQLLSDYNAIVNALNNSSPPNHLSGSVTPSLSMKTVDSYILADDLIALQNAFNYRKFI